MTGDFHSIRFSALTAAPDDFPVPPSHLLVTILTEFVWKHPFGVHSGLWGLLANFAVAYLLSVITKEVISDDSYEKFHRVLEREYGDTEETPSDVKMSV